MINFAISGPQVHKKPRLMVQLLASLVEMNAEDLKILVLGDNNQDETAADQDEKQSPYVP